ncbi:uncharacterized protein LOC136038383 [Artemia franciscana]|uniref:uncharacterized protein LOC136038383 n=1 Tax=Artemia franciscana TaxID=6661 RepID=UPI0032D9B5B1
MDEGTPVDMILLDLAKAFDKTCHRILYSKLCTMDNHDNVAKWTMQFLTNRKQVIRVLEDGRLIFFSESTHCTFNYRHVHDPKSVIAFQTNLDAFSNWARPWTLEFNIQKCRVIHFGANNFLYSV